MPASLKQLGLDIITGHNRSLAATAARAGLSAVEPFYAAAMRVRNTAYHRSIFASHDLGRPTISVGNITTGGTGKTPVVQWLADELRRRNCQPAILLRGYAAAAARQSDESQLLDRALNAGTEMKIPVQANPSRVQGAAEVLRDHPQVTHFILDDGFQHRKARRDFDLVLISATQPFGYCHVLPRGLLREPLSGLDRADAFLITRCSLVSAEALGEIDRFLADHHPTIPRFHCDHLQSSVWLPSSDQTMPIDFLSGKKVFLTAGIGDPAAFARQIAATGCAIAGTKWWPDHHAWTASDTAAVCSALQSTAAELLLTTQKDWVKMQHLVTAECPVAVINLEIRFQQADAEQLMNRLAPLLH